MATPVSERHRMAKASYSATSPQMNPMYPGGGGTGGTGQVGADERGTAVGHGAGADGRGKGSGGGKG